MQAEEDRRRKDCLTPTLSASQVLLLNASYEPMQIISWQKALILWCQNKVEIVDYHNVFARSVRNSFQIPSILRLKHYVKPRSLGAIRFCRENVFMRDNYTCQYCGDRHSPRHLTLDHIIPASKKGPKSWTNMVTACRDCNQRKANRTPQTANMPLLKEPTIPTWLPRPEMDVNNNQVPIAWLPYLPLKIS